MNFIDFISIQSVVTVCFFFSMLRAEVGKAQLEAQSAISATSAIA